MAAFLKVDGHRQATAKPGAKCFWGCSGSNQVYESTQGRPEGTVALRALPKLTTTSLVPGLCG